MLEETELNGDTTETGDESCQMEHKEYVENYDEEWNKNTSQKMGLWKGRYVSSVILK